MKKLISTILVICMLLSMVPLTISANAQTAPAQFRDVKSSDWYYDSVQYAVQNGLMVGTANGVFSPKMTFSRAMIVTVLWTLEGEPIISGSQFKDVPENSWFSTAVAWAAQNEIVSGYGNGKFGPNDPITREQLVSIFKNYTDFTGMSTSERADLSKFKDANKISSWAYDALSWAVSERLISGTSATTLSPKGQATRAEAAAMLEGYCPTLPDSQNEPALTKAEWISLIAQKMDIPLAELNEQTQYYYSDVIGHNYAAQIEAAQRFGLLPAPEVEDIEQDVPQFYPDDDATREFAAYVAVKALGFDGTHNFDTDGWADYSEIEYKDEISIAVSFGLLKIEDGRFRPHDKFTQSDADKIFAAIDRIQNASVITPDQYEDKKVFAQDAVVDELKSVTGYTVTDNGNDTYTVVLPLTMATSDIYDGNSIVLPANDEYPSGIAFTVIDSQTTGNTLKLTCKTPELEQIFDEIKFVGEGTPLVDKVVAADGVYAEYDPNGSIDTDGTDAYALNINGGGTIGMPGTLKFNVDKNITQWLKAKGSVEIKIPAVTAKVDASVRLFGGINVNEFLLSIQEEIKFDAALEYTLLESGYEITNSLGNTRWEGGRIELGRVPFQIGAVLSFDIIFYFNLEAKGSATISYTIVSTQGYHYKNGTSRAIFDFDDSLDLLELKGSFKAGLGISGSLCALHCIDIIGYRVEAGAAFNASLTLHTLATDTLVCGDVTLYAYCESGLDTETVVGKFLERVCHYTLEFEHLKNDENNPFKLKLHVENAHIVDECTFGTGEISGHVGDLNSRAPLANARIKIYNESTSDRNLVRTLYTDSQGNYSVDNLTSGNYKVVVSATGYFTYEVVIRVTSQQTTYIENLLMIDRDEQAIEYNVTGQITDAVTGYGISDTSYNLRQGWSNTTGEILRSGTFADNTYTITALPGNYTLEVMKDGYITNYTNIAISESTQFGTNIVLSPTSISMQGDSLRIVLTWGATPLDLDSHLVGVDPNYGYDYHVYYSDKTHSSAGSLIADLDVDDTSSYGPETITVHNTGTDGILSYYIHDYSYRSSNNSKKLSNSSAIVKVYSDNVCVYTFVVPTDKEGTLWHVFDYDAATDTITPVNAMSYQYDTSSIGQR